MPVIAELGLATGKSMAAAENVTTLRIDNRGLFGDRPYMWVEALPHTNVLYHKGETAEPGHFLSQREDPILTQVVPILQADGLTLQTKGGGDNGLLVPRASDIADNHIPVSVWDWRGEAVDQGNEAAEWGESIIGRPVRLVGLSDKKPRWVEDNPKLGRVGFSDGYPITVASTDSLAAVNNILVTEGHDPITIKQARATMLLSGLALPGFAELPYGVFPEDYVETIRIRSGGLIAILRRIKACDRCPELDTDQTTGKLLYRAPVRRALGRLARNGRHANTQRYSRKPKIFWTQNFVIELPDGMPPDATIDIHQGAEVEVEYSSYTNWTRP